MRAILESKILAVETLAAALDRDIRGGILTDVQGVQHFVACWLDGMRSLMPADVISSDHVPWRAWSVESDEPPTGTRMRDRDGDVWLRRANGRWAMLDGEGDEYDWEYVTRWAPLTEVTD